MNFSNGVNMPTYIVYRDSPVGQPFDATAPLAFFPPKDSDELFDALRAEFPHLKTHSERMREATIAYLIQERQDEQSPVPTATPMTETATTSPWLTSFPSMSTDSSTFSSPDMLGLATPSFGNSPQSQSAQLCASRQPSVAGPATTPSNTTPPALEQMTGVFSLSDSNQPKQRVRRKMTEAEKTEYRKRRIVKACEKCSKRKRKCNHNQSEMESLSRPSQKVEKSKPAAHPKKSAMIPMSLSPDPAPESINQPFIQGEDWLDFTLMDDPLPEMTFDDLLQPDLDRPLETQQYVRNQWPWGDDADFSTMMGGDFAPHNGDRSFFNDHTLQQGPLFDHTHADSSTLAFTTGNKKSPVGVQPQQQTRGGANGNGMLWEGLRTGQQDIAPTLERTPHTQHAQSGDAELFDRSFGDSAGDFGSYSGRTAPRKELTRNMKNPIPGDLLHDLDVDDHSVHQSEATTKNRRDRLIQANEQNRAGVRSVEGTGTKDILQAATRPQQQMSLENTSGLVNASSLKNASELKNTSGLKHASQDETHAASPLFSNAGRAMDAASEMFRLRHRMPGTSHEALQTDFEKPRTVVLKSPKFKGGTGLQLVTGNGATMAPSLTGLISILPATGAEQPARTRTPNAGASSNSPLEINPPIETSLHAIRSAAEADKPTHTRSRNPSASSGSNAETDQRDQSGAHAESTTIPGLHHSSRPRAHGRSPLQTATTAQSVSADVDSSSDFYQERLHDTVRYRDHFGRQALLRICSALLGAALLFCAVQNALAMSSAMLLRALSISPSMLLLALFAPSYACSKKSHAKFQPMYEEDASLDVWLGAKSDTMICQGIGSGKKKLLGAISGASKASGWVMTPHSSLKWAVQSA